MTPRFITSAARSRDFPPDSGREVAVAGRSNSGKSSAINRILGQSKLARVSKTPGRTQLVNFFELAPDRRLVDLPGYGFAKVPDAVRAAWRALIESYFNGRRSLCGLIVTIDVRRGLTELDRTMIAWAESMHVPMLLLLTKADKLSRGAGSRAREAVIRDAPSGTDVALFSSLKGIGAAEARERLLDWLALGG